MRTFKFSALVAVCLVLLYFVFDFPATMLVVFALAGTNIVTLTALTDAQSDAHYHKNRADILKQALEKAKEDMEISATRLERTQQTLRSVGNVLMDFAKAAKASHKPNLVKE